MRNTSVPNASIPPTPAPDTSPAGTVTRSAASKLFSSLRVSWRELWPAALTTVLLGLVFIALYEALMAVFSDHRYSDYRATTLAMLLATVWGGVAITSGSPQQQAFLLARPQGRVRRLAVPLAVLLVSVMAAGFGLELLRGLLTSDLSWNHGWPSLELQLNLSAWRLDRVGSSGTSVWTSLLELPIGLLNAATCGLVAGSLLSDRAPAYGLGFSLAIGFGRVPFMAAEASREAWIDAHPLPVGGPSLRDTLGPSLLSDGTFSLLLLGLTTLALAIPVWYYARRWAPLRTTRADLALTALIAAGLAGVSALAWVLAPMLLITCRVS